MRFLRRLLFAAVLLPAAQVPVVPPSGMEVGSQRVDGPIWNFDGDIAAGGGPFQSVTIANTSCDVPYRPGTAQAGAIIFTASLSATPTTTGLVVYSGDLVPFRNSNAHGHVQVLTLDDPDVTTHVDAIITDLDDFALNNTFRVCLTPGEPAPTDEAPAPRERGFIKG